MVVAPNVGWTKKWPPGKGGHFDSALCGCLYFYWRPLTRNTLPLTVGHFYPRISPALVNIKSLSRRIGALSFETSGRDSRVAKNGNLHVCVLDTIPFHRLRLCQRLGLIRDFRIATRIHEFVSQKRSEHVRIVCLHGLEPLFFLCGYSLLTPAGLLGLGPCYAPQ